MLNALSGIGSGVLLMLTLALLLRWKKKVPKVTALLMFGAGFGFLGVLNSVFGFVSNLATSLTGIGAGIASVVCLVLAFIVVHDLWPRHKANNLTGVAAFLLPTAAFVAAGGLVSRVIIATSGGIAEAASAALSRLF